MKNLYKQRHFFKGMLCNVPSMSLLNDCKNVRNILFEISRFRIVQFIIVTEMESALNYKDSDTKYVYVCVPESCLKLG